MLTEEKFRKALEQAKKEGEKCILIWSNPCGFDELKAFFKPGDTRYNCIRSSISQGYCIEIFDIDSLTGIIAIPVSKSNDCLKCFLNICYSGKYEGPITSLSLKELN